MKKILTIAVIAIATAVMAHHPHHHHHHHHSGWGHGGSYFWPSFTGAFVGSAVATAVRPAPVAYTAPVVVPNRVWVPGHYVTTIVNGVPVQTWVNGYWQ